jgi:stearoyl-CoA desaturase (delta-9 desaturase)
MNRTSCDPATTIGATLPAVAPPAVAAPDRFSDAATLAVVVVPFVGLLAAIVLLWGWGISWVELTMLLTMYFVSGLGVTVGFHRLFTHRSFETTRLVKLLLAVAGSMSLQGPLLKWVAVHRRHHQHSDEPDDPHSPHGHGGGVWGVLAGFWHAHVGWLFRDDAANLGRYVGDLSSDRMLSGVSRLFLVWAVLGLVLPATLGGLLSGSWFGVLLGFIWGGLVRVFVVHHMTWSINSVCHLWGTRPYDSRDCSRNNFIFGVLGFGEGWHNNHHAFPASARHGLRWWQFDISYWIIRAMSCVGLAWRIRTAAAEAVACRPVTSGV